MGIFIDFWAMQGFGAKKNEEQPTQPKGARPERKVQL